MANTTSQTPVEESFTLAGYVLKVFLWVIPSFFFWYFTAAIFCFPAIFLADLILPHLMPSIITAVEQHGFVADVVTELDVRNAKGLSGQLVFSINALKYAYGFPLLFAMTIATNKSVYNKLDTLTYGFIILIFSQTWSLCFEALSTLLLKLGGDNFQTITQTIPLYSDAWVLNGIALGYQLGFLILPAVVPIVFWVLRHQDFLNMIARRK
ncbi:MAG TPA: hypothetical protein ENJ28_09000 [Gammaproteobacteria bacterium]|nr:hypothetical protein [Gammaproteobacteria bacterium]